MGSNKQFNNILDECLERLLTGQETVEQCLQRCPEYATELEPLLRTAMIINKAVDVKPSVDFRARARYQMQLKIAESKAPQRAVPVVPRWAIAICAVMLVFVLGGGTVLAANSSMPGNPLYTVKLATENLSVKLAGSEEKKAELYVTMTNQRVTEMAWMVDNGKTQDLEAAAQRLKDYYTKIGELPLAGSSEMTFSAANTAKTTGNVPAVLQSTPLQTTTVAQGEGDKSTFGSTVPTTIAGTTTAVPTVTVTVVVPPPITVQSTVVPPVAATTTAVVTTKNAGNEATPNSIVPAPVTTTITLTQSPAALRGGNNATAGNSNEVATNNSSTLNANNNAKLLNILQYYAVTQPEELQQFLDSDKVPESVKPTLRLALSASKAGYQNAINNLSH